jgi:hypothetical protein
MKGLTIFILFFCLLTQGYRSKKELNHEEALSMIMQEKEYPLVIDYDIYSSDPAAAKKVLDAGLETEGLVTVKRTQKL